MQIARGYTTGTCAQAAAKAACIMLVNRAPINNVCVTTPKGQSLSLELIEQTIGDDFATCAVIKDSGDELEDVTDGVKICARVRYCSKKGIFIQGGEGVGKITKPGLSLPVGEWAINPVPRKMILEEISRFLVADKGLEVTISVPGGKALAKKTYNPRLGIIGGISIIGTTGIVVPKSKDAFRASLSLELDVLKAQGVNKGVLVLGYVGEKFCKERLGIKEEAIIKIGDYVGFMLKQCAENNFKEVLLVGHIGKLIKVANGQFNTHYRFGDKRVKLIAQYAKLCGAADITLKDILRQATAEGTIGIILEAGLSQVFKKVAQDIQAKAKELVGNGLKVNCIILSLEGKILADV